MTSIHDNNDNIEKQTNVPTMPPPPSPIPNKKKLNEMLGDGTFEKLMKERTKVSSKSLFEK